MLYVEDRGNEKQTQKLLANLKVKECKISVGDNDPTNKP